MDKYSGKKLDGRYEIHELIGVGGMAYVYRCTDTIDDREVAVKILKDEFLNNEEFIRRFKNESKAIAMLSHPNIVKVYDVSFGDMIQYIVMEYIDGITLKEYIAQQGILDWREALHLTTQILKALKHAHSKGVVHRDIKPHNIMLLQDGTIKVTDFGIARLTDTQTKTMTEQAIGSVHYIAPEQARGSKTDGKSDIYSVGVMLYEMLTGKLPFDADSAVSVALMQLQSTPVMPREINPAIPVGLEQITMHAMQKNPADRYSDALDMLGDLERFRLNPAVRFDYKYFVDSDPTKYVKVPKKTKKQEPETKEENVKTKQENQVAEDIDKKKIRSNAFHIVRGGIIGFAVVLVLVLVISLFRGVTSNPNTDVEVPKFIGKMWNEVQDNSDYKFRFETKKDFREGYEIGEIIDQDPKPGSIRVKADSAITLTICGKDKEVSVPLCDFTTKKSDAIKVLKNAYLSPTVIEVYSNTVPKNYVCATFPPTGAKTQIDEPLYLFVSKGERPEKIKIPDLTGGTLYEAEETLGELNLGCKYEYDNQSMEPKGTVIGQSPLQHSEVESGSVVSLIVSSGEGSKRTIEVTVDMPTNYDGEVELTVSVDGTVDSDYTKTIDLRSYTKYTMSFTGSGNSNVSVMLNDQTYRVYNINYLTGTYSTSSYGFNPPEEPTEPETEEETEPVEVEETELEEDYEDTPEEEEVIVNG